MRGNAVKCHTCGKFDWQLDNGTAPIGWLQLVRVDSKGLGSSEYGYAGSSTSGTSSRLYISGMESKKDFCSGKCLRKYIKDWK